MVGNSPSFANPLNLSPCEYIVKVAGACPRVSEAPFLLHMLGIPGAGKTSFLDVFQSLWVGDDEPFLLGFDQVMQSLPQYQEHSNKVEAFSHFEVPARELGYTVLEYLVQQKCNILFDNGGSAATHLDILRRAQAVGYRIILVSLVTDIAAAQRRVDTRAVSEGRHTPMNYLDERALKLADLEADYKKLTPYFYQIDNKGQDFPAFQKKCVEVAVGVLHDLGEGKRT